MPDKLPGKINEINKTEKLEIINEDKYIAAFLLYALGDTIGFKNGEWEFNYYQKTITLNMTTELLYDFISLGGINDINLDGWYVSDDTIINLAIAKGLLESKYDIDKIIATNKPNNKATNTHSKTNDDIIHNVEQEMIIAFNEMLKDKDKGKDRYFGVTTWKYIKLINKGKDGRTLPYDKMSGGNGAAMRAGPIGLVYYGEKNRNLLIKSAIDLSRITHNSAYGYLGGLTMALFTSFVIEQINIKEWPFLLIKLLNSQDVRQYMKKDTDEEDDYEKFINYWIKYIDTRFDNKDPIMSRSHKNLIFRSRYYYENFTRDTESFLIGESGFCAMIMAYDSLLDSGNVWEKLVIYSGLHLGDSDTTCAIASFLYGLMYGLDDVPENNLKYLEFKDELIDVGKKMYNNFVK